MPVVQDHKW